MQRFIDENGYEYYVDLSGNYTPTGRRLRIKQKITFKINKAKIKMMYKIITLIVTIIIKK